eukprot:Seg3401.2 transcript_id=Seg3401.2/GoldUCD/mRNA.D3Y31 product="Trace amine-associated receptor 3" protein_id=Seg3401.2/GoldUCD/D3Y31
MVCNSQEELRDEEILNAIITTIKIVDILLTLWTIAGNAICIFTFAKTRSLHTRSNVLVGALCVTDLYAGLIMQPIFLSICFILPSQIDVSSLYATSIPTYHFGFVSSFCLTYLVTMDRYFAIWHPFRYTEVVTARRYYYAIFMALFIALIVTIIAEYRRYELFICNLVLQTFIIPQVIICYVLIYRVICRKRKVQVSIGNIDGCDRAKAREQKEENKKAYTIGIIIVVFLACYSPPMVIFLFVLGIKDDCVFIENQRNKKICLSIGREESRNY